MRGDRRLGLSASKTGRAGERWGRRAFLLAASGGVLLAGLASPPVHAEPASLQPLGQPAGQPASATLADGARGAQGALIQMDAAASPQPVAQGVAGQGGGQLLTERTADGRPVARPGVQPDLSALRYYILSRQKERADAELRRIQRLYPGWTPPPDIYDTAENTSGDEEPFWALFAADRLDELKAAIEARRKSEPGWQPSRDLRNKIARKILRTEIEKASREGREKLVLSALRDSGLNERDLELDLLWLVAAAEARSGQPEKALDAYKLILSTNNNPQERIATVQKAMAVLPMNDVDQLVAMARTVNGASELEPIAIDIIRARISAFLKEERTQPVDPDELRRFEEYANSVDDGAQAALVAWYFYNQKDYRQAFDWFKTSISKGGDAMVAHGLALTLVNLTMYREAEEVAYAWRNALINNMILYVDILERDLTKAIPPYIEPERLARYGQVAMQLTSGEAAQGLAWYAYNSCQYDVALQWFSRAMAWYPKEATAYGYALALDRMKDRQTLADVINRYDGLFYKVVELVFPDGTIKPPTPCDLQERQQAEQRRGKNRRKAAVEDVAAAPQAQGGATYLGQNYPQQIARMQGGGAMENQGLAGSGLRGSVPRVPAPEAALGGVDLRGQPLQGAPAQPKLTAKEFPISVNPANPLRYAGIGPGAVVGAPYSAAAGYLAEPVKGPWPLVARRVPGVGPMPYERYGFSLLPAWNGLTTATEPTYATQPAPAGTLWAEQRHADQYIGGR